jgi:hypothetical protein
MLQVLPVALLTIVVVSQQTRRPLASPDSLRPEPVLLEVRIGNVAAATLQAMRHGDSALFHFAELRALAGLPAIAGSASYVSADSMSAILHARITVDWDDLTATIADDGTLPVSRAAAREQRRAVFQRDEARASTTSPISASISVLPHDLIVDYDLESAASRGTRSTTIHTGVGTSIFGGALDFDLTHARHFAQSSFSWERVRPDNAVFRDVRIGSISLGATGTGTGLFISSQLPDRLESVAPLVLTDVAGSDWQVEVYRNDALVFAGLTDSSGRYSVRVPVFRGVNKIAIAVYGAAGQQRVIDRYVSVGDYTLRRGTGAYDLSIGRCESIECSYAAQFDMRYAPYSIVTLGAGVTDVISDDGERLRPSMLLAAHPRDDVNAVATSTDNSLAIQAHYAPTYSFDLTATYRGRSASSAMYRGLSTPPSTSVTAAWRIPNAHSISTVADFTDRDITGRARLRVASSISIMGTYLRPSASLARRIGSHARAISYGGYAESWVPILLPPGSRIRAGVADAPSADSFAALVLPFAHAGQLQLGVDWIHGVASPQFTLSLSMVARSTRYAASAISSVTGVMENNTMSGSVALSAPSAIEPGFMAASPIQRRGRAELAGTVFIDDNQNGRRDPCEAALPGVTVAVGNTSVDTDSAGVYHVRDVTPFIPLVLIADSLTLPSAAMHVMPVRVVPLPNGITRVDLPATDGSSPGLMPVTARVNGIAQDAQGGDSASVHRDHLEAGARNPDPVADTRQPAEPREYVSAERRPVTVGNVELVVAPRIDERQRPRELENTVHLERRARRHVVLIGDVAHHFFYKVLDRDDARGSTVLVDHHSHISARPAQIVQHALRRSAVGNVKRFAHQLRELERRSRLSQPQVLREEDSYDVVKRFAVQGIA